MRERCLLGVAAFVLAVLVGCKKKPTGPAAAQPHEAVAVPAVAPAPPAPRADGKNGTVYPGWGKLFDPANDTEVHLQDGRLSVVVPPGLHDINHNLGGMHAPRLLQEVDGDFTAEVTVTGDFSPGPVSAKQGVASFNGAGLSLWLDEQNYLRLERNAWWNAAAQDYIGYTPLFEVFVNGSSVPTSPGTGPANDFFGGPSTRFRLRRTGQAVFASYSLDGTTWRTVPEVVAALPRKLLVGVGAVSTSSQPFSVVFDNFKLDTN